jgi:hypothetical protein
VVVAPLLLCYNFWMSCRSILENDADCTSTSAAGAAGGGGINDDLLFHQAAPTMAPTLVPLVPGISVPWSHLWCVRCTWSTSLVPSPQGSLWDGCRFGVAHHKARSRMVAALVVRCCVLLCTK